MKIRAVESVYNHDQLQEYLGRIGWTGTAPKPDHESLVQLMQHHIRSIPFGNTFIVYETEPAGIDPQELFERLVRRKGGFFCFGQNLLFREILRLIGFRCYSTAARVNSKHASSDDTELGGLSHMCTFVSLEDDPAKPDEDHLWLVDVGFGGPNLNVPIPLHDNAIVQGALNEWHRISVIEHPKSALQPGPYPHTGCPLPLGRAFALQYQARDPDGTARHPWRICYAFTLNEMHSGDYESFHFSICRRPGLFTQNVLLSMHIAPKTHGEPMTRVTLFNNRLQQYRIGQEPKKTPFETEADRLEAIKQHFGLGNIPADAESVIRRKGLSLS